MQLFFTPASPFVRKVMVAAVELGLDRRIEILPTYWPHDWGDSTIAFAPAFIAANPVGRIPTLVTDDGIAIPESNWICDHLQSLVEAPVLLPGTGPLRSRCGRLLGIADGALEAMIARRAELLRDPARVSRNFVAKSRDRIARCLDALEAEIVTLEGDVTLAQIAVGAACGYMDFRYRAEDWRTGRPRLARWYEGFAARPSMVRTVPTETPQQPAEP